ncbi:hypothetical protein [Streptomyces sp. NPDC060198]|uniref:hypothetical protein n=1 Tax=Streptomyces sp. NPDC060198 TaxID=3347070 RepID=UPI0036525E94
MRTPTAGTTGAARGTRAAARRSPRLYAVTLTALGLLTTLVSCTSPPAPLTTACGVVVDGSGSGASSNEGFDAEGKLKATLLTFLDDEGCGTVDFAPITRASQSSSCRVEGVDLDPPHKETTDQESQRRKARNVAAGRSLEELKCARSQNGSDVWGALDRIATTLPPDSSGAKLLVVSDFAQADPDFVLSMPKIASEEQRTEAVDSLVAERGVPGIKGMNVYPVGFGMQFKAKPGQFEDFEAFWLEILEGRAKAHVHTDYR